MICVAHQTGCYPLSVGTERLSGDLSKKWTSRLHNSATPFLGVLRYPPIKSAPAHVLTPFTERTLV